MKNKTKKLLILSLLVLVLTSGCAKVLKGEDKKPITTEDGRTLYSNILCKPTDEESIRLYGENNVDLENLVECKNLKVTTGGYEGLWESIFVKPIAALMMFMSKYVKSVILAMVLLTLAIRFLLYPVTQKTAMQSEMLKKAQPEIDKLEKKYQGKDDQDSLMKKSTELSMIYKKYNINPASSCLFSFIQIPLLFAFLEAINRLPALYEEKVLTMKMGTTPWIGITGGNYTYLVIVIILALVTFFSFRFNGQDQAGMQQEQMKTMTITMSLMIIFMSFMMPAALGVYWIVSSGFTIIQNLLVKRSKKNG